MGLARTAIVAFLLSACSSASAPFTSPSASPSISVTAAPTATVTPAVPTTTPSIAAASPPATPRPITDPNQAIFSAAAGWRATGTTLVVAGTAASGATTLVALPISPSGAVGAPTTLVSFVPDAWALRRDGSAAAIVVATPGRSRIAIWETSTGAIRWLTSSDQGPDQSAPVWSSDGASIYFMETTDTARKMVALRADGTARREITIPDRFDGGVGLTPDGKGLVWSRGQAGGSVDILDLATGANRHLQDNASVAAWRDQQPRALLLVGGCCAGPPGASLELWDDVALTSRVIAARGPQSDAAFGTASWDPRGARFVAVRYAGTRSARSLAIIDPATGAVQDVARTEGATSVLWLDEGIVFTRPAIPNGADLLLIPAAGGEPTSIHQGFGGIGSLFVVRP